MIVQVQEIWAGGGGLCPYSSLGMESAERGDVPHSLGDVGGCEG